MNDALNEMRHRIQLYAYLTMFKTTNIRGQKANTCAHSALDYAEKKKQQAKDEYTVARAALEVLGPLLGKVGWDSQLWLLCDCDLRYMSDMLDGQTEGTHDLSWIWKMPGIMENSKEGLQDSLQVEWCKAHTCADQWQDEVTLLKEEMQRIKMFLEWEKYQWLQCDQQHACLRQRLTKRVPLLMQNGKQCCRGASWKLPQGYGTP
ncbi:hypothetical protein JVT61DRAFT_10989 [Boletus reticuloceps]|uniref:Uncharacterized protein n=1 Tax=Boletus reticuloceps TaxID=495285 RepID=A0A8I2YF72_9AGAM|nr:hypothetical protein JVT61DRAFT_10989 [Boletus reticuloceps]